MLPLSALLLTHVPGYGGDCQFNCCHPPHPTKLHVSQAVYLKGTAGIEIDLVDIQDYIEQGKNIEFSVVFKEEYDPRCASHRTPDNYHGWDVHYYTTNLWPKPMTYQPGHLEPFTQHAYFPLLPKGEARMFNASQLRDCDSDHFSIRLVTYDNSSHDLTYSIALGCEDGLECEQFSFMELFLFPLYVYRTHGTHWNNYGWTLPVIGIAVAVLYTLALWFFFNKSWLALYQPVAILQPQKIYELGKSMNPNSGYDKRFVDLPCVSWKPSLRCGIYMFVIYALVVDLFESLTHAIIALGALGHASQPYEARGVGLFFGIVVGFGKIAPLVLVALVWRFHRAVPEFVWRTYVFKCQLCGSKYEGFGRYSPMWAHGAWSIIEIWFLGVTGLIWLGAGYWIFPFGMMIAGAFRLGIWLVNPEGYQRGVQFEYPTFSERWGGLGGECDDKTKKMLLDVYNSYYDERSYTSDRAPLMRQEPAPDAPPPAGNPMPLVLNGPPPPPYSTGNNAATRPLSRAELVRLGQR